MIDGASGLESGNLTLSSGGTALEGYFYQLDVSILTALDLVLAKKVAHSVVLEPVSEEDLEADVENAPGALTEEIKLDAYRLVIQCKLRSTWHRRCERSRDAIRILLIIKSPLKRS